MNLHMKTLLLCFFLLGVVSVSNAQIKKIEYVVGLGLGANLSYTDVKQGNWGNSVSANFDYFISPEIAVGLELQYGLVQGGDYITDPYNRQFSNRYASFTLNGKAMVVRFLDYERSDFLYSIRGLYAGVGLGVIKNHIISVVRFSPQYPAELGYKPYPGKDDSFNMIVPLNLGYDFNILESGFIGRFILNVNAQSNFTFGEGLDGYESYSGKAGSPDIFNVYSVGIKYVFSSRRRY